MGITMQSAQSMDFQWIEELGFIAALFGLTVDSILSVDPVS